MNTNIVDTVVENVLHRSDDYVSVRHAVLVLHVVEDEVDVEVVVHVLRFEDAVYFENSDVNVIPQVSF